MVYLIGALMGYFVGTNALVEKQAQRFVGSDYGDGFLEGFYFVLAVMGGALISGILQIPGINYLLSAITLFVNIGLAIAVYSMT